MGKPKKSKRGAQQRSSDSKTSKKPKRLQQKPGGFNKGSSTGNPTGSSGGMASVMDNPFEIRMNKRKHDNLGRTARNEQGVPGISRSRAIEKRNATLLKEYKVRNKTNSLLDRRIGEKRKGMAEEEKIIRRSAAEKARQFKKKSIFNLQDSDDFLTHKGQPLGDIDRYEDPRDASDSEDERLDADFVSDANFGGFMKMKKAEDQEIDEGDLNEFGQPKTQKEIIQELILASKKKKFEKAKEADESYELVCKLDDEFKTPDFKNLLLLGGGKAKGRDSESNAPSSSGAASAAGREKEDYDKIVRELQFETKTGRAADRLKTEDEIANEEVEKLQLLEKQRLARMRMTDDGNGVKHRSADDLDDGFAIDEPQEGNGEGDEEEEEASEEEDAEEDEASNESDNFSDIESEPEAEAEEADPNESSDNGDGEDPPENQDDNKDNTKTPEKKAEMSDFSEIPYVMTIPVNYNDYEKLLKKYGAHYKSKKNEGAVAIATFDVILSRMIKYNKAADRSRLPQLFNYMMRYVLESVEFFKKLSKTVKEICQVVLPYFHALLILNPTEYVETVEKGEIFDGFYPVTVLPLFKILYFDLCASLFSCTDFHHHVLSPGKTVLLNLLEDHKVLNFQSLLKIFYIVKVLYKMSHEAKRYCPEVVNILISVLQCFHENPAKPKSFVIPAIRPAQGFLFISDDEDCKKTQVDDQLWKLLSDKGTPIESTLSRRLGILHLTLQITKQFTAVYEKLPSSKEIFGPFKRILLELKTRSNYPKSTKKLIEETLQSIDNLKQKKDVLAIAVSDRPKPLRLYEPLIEEDFDGIRKKKAPKGKQETARLAHKVKQEMKNAVREIRKDTSFLAKQQLKEELQKDADRKRKVKDIMGSLASQEGEYQKSKRAKK